MSDLSSLSEKKRDVLKAFLLYLVLAGQKMSLGREPIASGVLGIMFGMTLGVTLGTREPELAEKLNAYMDEMSKISSEAAALGGYAKVVEKAQAQISDLINLWDQAVD